MKDTFWYGFLLCGLVAFTCGTLPDYIHVCKSDDPELDKCIINSIYLLETKLKEGIPELHVPPLEPLELDEIKLRKGIQANITNLKVWGPSNCKILELKANVPENLFVFKILLPFLHFKANYDLKAKILMLNVQGNGPIQGNFTMFVILANYTYDGILNGTRIQQDGEEYLRFDKMSLKIQFGESEMKLENLFDGHPTLGKVVNDVINDNNEAFLNQIKPSLESAIADKFTDLANKITLHFTHKELFLD